MNENLIQYFDPFIGSLGKGDCLCGPYLPHSLVRPGPDTVPPHRTSGYGHHDLNDDSPLKIYRFSQNHVSGTGGAGRYGNIAVIPSVGKISTHYAGFSARDEHASAGYYSVHSAEDDIRTEISCTPRVAAYRFTFPGNLQSNIIIDTGSIIQTSGKSIEAASLGHAIGGYIERINDHEIIGRADLKGGWGHDFPYSVYFFARFDLPIEEVNVSKNNCLIQNERCDGANARLVANFSKATEVNLQIGISYVSIANARASVARESVGKSFTDIRTEAEQVWQREFEKIAVSGGSEEQKTLFYTAFARLICMPSDLGIDDENCLWKSGKRAYTDYYALWDSVRNANSLISLFNPQLEVDMLNALLDVADHTGWIPDAWIAGHSAHIQGGSSADILISEAKLKGLEGIDYEKALTQMRKNNEVHSPNPFLYGRYLDSYNTLGYVATDDCINCVSKHIEYSYQDFCIAQLANELGQENVAKDYSKGSEKIWNLWRDDLKVFAPKDKTGTWIDPFDPKIPTRPDYWNDPYFYEGTAQEWAFSALHHIDTIVEKHGGKEAFAQHLDRFFAEYLYSWKEIILHTPYLYHYAGMPWRSTERAWELFKKYYHTGREGVPDNEDMGCQSAYVMCTAMGLYPVMGQDIYLISTPIFNEVRISLGDPDKQLHIKVNRSNDQHYHIQSACLNGKAHQHNWLSHHAIKDGGDLILEVGDTVSDWGVEATPSPKLPTTS